MVPSFFDFPLYWVMFLTIVSSSMVIPSLFVKTSRDEDGAGVGVRRIIRSNKFLSDKFTFWRSDIDSPLSTDVLELKRIYKNYTIMRTKINGLKFTKFSNTNLTSLVKILV